MTLKHTRQGTSQAHELQHEDNTLMFSIRSIAERHDVILYACCLLAFMGVATHGVGLFFALLFLAAWGGSYMLFRLGKHTILPVQLWNVVILLTVAGTVAMMIFSEESVISSGVRFILMLIAIKLMSRKGDERDDWQIYALTFLLMAAGTAVNEDILYGVVFALYVLLGTFGLALLHLRTEQDRTGLPPTSAMHRNYGRILIALAGVVFASSVAIFFTFPRVGLGFFATKTRASMAMTGFSEQVELGSHGIIRNNPEVVMRVEFPDDRMPPEAESYHWRMMSFDNYDGVQWSRTRLFQRARFDTISREPPRFDTTSLYAPALREKISSQRGSITLDIYMEPLNAKQVPQLWPMNRLGLPQSIRLPFNPNASWPHYDTYYQDLYIEQRNELGVAYSLEVVPKPSLSDLDNLTDYESLHPERNELYLQLPDDLERMRALTDRLVGEETNPYKIAQLIENHLQTSYAYTTDLPPVEGGNPVESFLFVTKQGHCEFFATTMTLMMRAKGIPARLVNGFLGGVWNNAGNYMSVRQGDAHSWVEVYLPRYGWVPFDPTPSAGTRPVQNDNLAQQIRDIYDTARMRWMQWVIEYNLDAQIAGLRRLSELLSPAKKESSSPTEQKQRAEEEGFKLGDLPLETVLTILGVLLLSALCAWHVRRILRKRAARESRLRHLAKPALAMLLWCVLAGVWTALLLEAKFAVLGALGPFSTGLLTWIKLYDLATTSSPIARAQRLLYRIERAARRRNIRREMDEGALQFIARLGSRHYPTHTRPFGIFSRIYAKARFSGEELTQEEWEELNKLTAHLTRAIETHEAADEQRAGA